LGHSGKAYVFSRLNRKAEKVNKLLLLQEKLILLKNIDEK
jgi:hypothetical protein